MGQSELGVGVPLSWCFVVFGVVEGSGAGDEDSNECEASDQHPRFHWGKLAMPYGRHAVGGQLQLTFASTRVDRVGRDRSSTVLESDLRARAHRHARRILERRRVVGNSSGSIAAGDVWREEQ